MLIRIRSREGNMLLLNNFDFLNKWRQASCYNKWQDADQHKHGSPPLHLCNDWSRSGHVKPLCGKCTVAPQHVFYAVACYTSSTETMCGGNMQLRLEDELDVCCTDVDHICVYQP